MLLSVRDREKSGKVFSFFSEKEIKRKAEVSYLSGSYSFVSRWKSPNNLHRLDVNSIKSCVTDGHKFVTDGQMLLIDLTTAVKCDPPIPPSENNGFSIDKL